MSKSQLKEKEQANKTEDKQPVSQGESQSSKLGKKVNQVQCPGN